MLPLLGSCGSLTVERQVFPICLAVDVTETGQFLLTIQSPLGKPSTGVSDSGAGADGYEIIAAQGNGLFAGLHKLESTLPFPLNFSQLRLLVFSSDIAARYDLRPLLMDVFHFPSVRATASVMISEGTAGQLLHAQRSSYGLRLSTHLDTLVKQLHTNGYLPNSTIASAVQSIGSGRFDPLLCLGAVNPALLKKQSPPAESGGGGGGQGGSGGGGGGDKKEDSASVSAGLSPVLSEQDVAGNLLAEGANPVEFGGAAITANGYVVGYLSPRETVVYNHLVQNAKRRCAIHGESLQLQLIMDKGEPDVSEMVALMKKFQVLHADPLGFGNVAACSFLTNADWDAYGFEERYPVADLYVGE